MAFTTAGRVVVFSLFLIQVISQKQADPKSKISENDVVITPLRPSGIRITVQHKPKLHLVIFQANINREIEKNNVGTINGKATEKYCDKWVIDNPNITLKVGDVLNYYIFVSQGGAGYILDQLSYKVTELKDKPKPQDEFRCEDDEAVAGTPTVNTRTTTSTTTTARTNRICSPTVTRVRARSDKLCSGDVIFTEDFRSKLQEDVWQIEQYIPMDQPEYPFMSYQILPYQNLVGTYNDNLVITPKLQQTLPGFTKESIYSGTLDLLNGCTKNAEVCVKQAFGANILPPVASGKITSKNFAFIYGTVELRAKLPQGDWIYPEIQIEPVQHKYGISQYASGLIKIASARGNKQLYSGPSQYGNNLLYGGPIVDSNCPEALMSSKLRHDAQNWGDDFHVFSLRWAPDQISLSVDGEKWLEVSPDENGLRGRLPAVCNRLSNVRLNTRSHMAPFDDFFQLALGVGVGGVVDFRDDTYTTAGRAKPWKNRSSKGLLNFWNDLESWYATWQQPQLIVDYIKVTAL